MTQMWDADGAFEYITHPEGLTERCLEGAIENYFIYDKESNCIKLLYVVMVESQTVIFPESGSLFPRVAKNFQKTHKSNKGILRGTKWEIS